MNRPALPGDEPRAAGGPLVVAPSHQSYAHAARRLLDAVLTDIPRRVAVMKAAGERKYQDLDERPDREAFFKLALDHLAGKRTIAVTLADSAGLARAGCRDYDAGGEAALLAALDADAARGIVSFALVLAGGDHSGGHLWRLYAQPAPARDIRADLRRLPGEKGELYPGNNPIRLPFGYHRRKMTRGMLILQDGRRFDLDTPAGLRDGLAAVLALPRNAPPPATASDDRGTGDAWGAHSKPELWDVRRDGAALWHSGRVKAACGYRPQLAALIRGERVTLPRNGEPDDSNSSQVATLVWNLIGLNFPEDEIRAIADYLHPQLRPNRSKEHYRAHVDAEIAKCRATFRTYNPQPTRFVAARPPGDATTPAPLPPAQRKAAPASRARKDRPRKVEGAPGYLAWLVEQAGPAGVLLKSQAQCAAELGCSLRTIKRYEKELRDAGAIERAPWAQRQMGRVFIRRGDNIPETNPSATAADVVTAPPPLAHSDAQNRDTPRAIENTLPPLGPGSLDARAAPPANVAPLAHAATVEHIRLAPAGAPLGDVIRAALDLLEGASRKKKRVLVRAMVEAERGPIDPKEFLVAYRAELDRRKLAALDTKALRREYAKRARYADRVQRDAASGKATEGQAWAAAYAVQRAADMLTNRTGTPTAPDYGPDGRMRGQERRELAGLRDAALDARDARTRRDYERGKLDAAIYGPARPRRTAMTAALRAALAAESDAQMVEGAALAEAAPALGAARGGSVLSLPPAGPPGPSPAARGLLARLYARRDGVAPEHLRDALAATLAI